MIPVQMIRVGLGDEAIHVPVFRMAYGSGRDAFAQPGGFFVTSGGEYGIVVDARLSPAEASAAAADELRKKLPKLQSLVAEQVAKLKGQQRSANAS